MTLYVMGHAFVLAMVLEGFIECGQDLSTSGMRSNEEDKNNGGTK